MLGDAVHHASWLDADGMRCYQLMEAQSLEIIQQWMAEWDDLMDCEVVPVSTSADFWAAYDAVLKS